MKDVLLIVFIFVSVAFKMNWKLLLFAFSLILGISARPAEETTPESSTISVPTSTDLPITRPGTTPESTTARYLIASLPTKPTNSRNKYVNNYANLITKHTLNQHRISNLTVESGDANNSNMAVSVHGIVVSSFVPEPTALSSSAVTSNSSSRPLVFVDADATITTRRAFIGGGTWSNYNIERPKLPQQQQQRKKPVIHKIISKWSDNPNEVFNLHGGNPLQATEITHLKDHLVQNAFGGVTHHYTTYRPSNPSVTNVVTVLKKKPVKASFIKKCKKVKIKLGNSINSDNFFSSKEDCEDVKIEIANKIHNVNKVATTTEGFLNNDKFEDASDSDYDSAEGEKNGGLVAVDTPAPQFINSITQIKNPKPKPKPGASKETASSSNLLKHKKKKPASANQIEEEDGDGGTSPGSMIMTMMTMMAIFNPLNFGVWGIIMAPMAAMLFGGICFAGYHVMNHPAMKQQRWSPHEIVIKNKIRHSPIPIKVMHLHKHSRPPPNHIVSEPVESYGPPMMFTPPWSTLPSKYTNSPSVVVRRPMTSYGEPPAIIDDYQPSAPAGGPYRKSNMGSKKPQPLKKPTKNSYKFKLL